MGQKICRKRTTSTQRTLLLFQVTQKHLILLETIKTFRARELSSVETRENVKIVDLSVLTRVLTEAGCLFQAH